MFAIGPDLSHPVAKEALGTEPGADRGGGSDRIQPLNRRLEVFLPAKL